MPIRYLIIHGVLFLLTVAISWYSFQALRNPDKKGVTEFMPILFALFDPWNLLSPSMKAFVVGMLFSFWAVVEAILIFVKVYYPE